jgi:hypothetical protein
MIPEKSKGVGGVRPVLATVDHNPTFLPWNYETYYIHINLPSQQGGSNRYLIYLSSISYIGRYQAKNLNKQQLNTAGT